MIFATDYRGLQRVLKKGVFLAATGCARTWLSCLGADWSGCELELGDSGGESCHAGEVVGCGGEGEVPV